MDSLEETASFSTELSPQEIIRNDQQKRIVSSMEENRKRMDEEAVGYSTKRPQLELSPSKSLTIVSSTSLNDVSALQTQIETKAEKSSIPIGLFTKFYESSQYSYVANSWIAINHNLNLTAEQIQRAIVIPYLICTSSIAGYALGQIIPMPQILGYNSHPIPQPFFLTTNKLEQRTGDDYAFWLNRHNRNYGYHYLTTGDIVNCFKYFFRIWY